MCYPVYAPWKLCIIGNGWVNFGFVIKDVRKYRLSLLDKHKLLWYNSSTFHRKRESHSIVSSYAKCQAKNDDAVRPSPCSEGDIGRLHLKGVIRFHDRKAYCAFFVPFSLENTNEGEKTLQEREVKIIIHGDMVIKQMGKAERAAFIAALLARVLETTQKHERGRDNGV